MGPPSGPAVPARPSAARPQLSALSLIDSFELTLRFCGKTSSSTWTAAAWSPTCEARSEASPPDELSVGISCGFWHWLNACTAAHRSLTHHRPWFCTRVLPNSHSSHSALSLPRTIRSTSTKASLYPDWAGPARENGFIASFRLPL